jgi:hypothetical protein
VGLAFLRGELVRPTDSAAACALFLDARRLYEEAPISEQTRFGSIGTIQKHIADCAAENNEGPAPSREAP